MMYYFAYGSNLHPVRLMERVPSAELIGVARHSDHALAFHKKSHDGSSKCNMLKSEAGVVYGAIYKLNPKHKDALDKFEGKGNGYIDHQIIINYDDIAYSCFTYSAQSSHIVDNLSPYHWYKELVVAGAHYLAFPDAYMSSIEAVASMDDPDLTRSKEMAALIGRILNYR